MLLALPLLLLVLATVVELGRSFEARITLMNAAREGARYGSLVPTSSTGIIAATRQAAANGGIPENSVTVTIVGLNGAAGSKITVNTSYPLPTIFGGIVGLNSITIHASTSMVVFGPGG
jgi:Flp pilus assembly protein TadG